MPEMTLDSTQLRRLLSLGCFVGSGEEFLRVVLHCQTPEAKLQLVWVVDAARVPGETWQEEERRVIGELDFAQGWFRWSAEGPRTQNPWEGNGAARSRRGPEAAWPPKSSKFMFVGPGSHEGLAGGKGSGWAPC